MGGTVQQQGSNTTIICATEATFGTVSTSVDVMVIPFVSESLRESRNLISSKTIRSTRNPAQPSRGNVEVGGDITMELSHQHGRLMRYALGTYTAVSGESVGMSAGTYKHTMKIGTLPSFSVEKRFTDLDTDKYFQYRGCKINTMKVAFKTEGPIDFSVSIMGVGETVAASTMCSSPSPALDTSSGIFDNFSAVITDKNGATIGDITALEFTINNDLDGSTYVIDGTGRRKAMPAGIAAVTGSMTVLFMDTTLYDLAVAYTESSVKVVCTRGTGDGTANNEKITFYLNELIYKQQAPVVEGPQGVLVELPFEAYYSDDSDASALIIEELSTRAYY